MMTLVAALAAAASAAASSPEPGVGGPWRVDLTAKAGDTLYIKDMRLDLGADGSLTGSFYDSDIQAGRWATSRGRTCVSFRTTDGAGPYHTSACLVGDQIEGQTWAEHRGFVFLWRAIRPKN